MRQALSPGHLALFGCMSGNWVRENGRLFPKMGRDGAGERPFVLQCWGEAARRNGRLFPLRPIRAVPARTGYRAFRCGGQRGRGCRRRR